MTFSKSPTSMILAGTAAMLTTGGLAVAGIHVIGSSLLAAPAAEAALAPVETAQRTIQLDLSPAEQILSAALTEPPKGWSARGDVQWAAPAPAPYSCPVAGKSAVTSLARSFTAGGANLSVTLTAYSAGIGAEAMEELNAHVFTCSTPESTGWDILYGHTATEAYIASVARAGKTVHTASFRLGDVIGYVSGDNPEAVRAQSVVLAGQLRVPLQAACLAMDSAAADASRSRHSTAGYKPFTVPAEVAIKDPGLPELPEDSKADPVSLPGPDIHLTPVEPTETPEWPVWPMMPAEMEIPEAPDSPAAAPVLAASFPALTADTRGPGCGWAFTGMPALLFDGTAAQATNTDQEKRTRDKLKADAKKWSADVLAYWNGYEAFSAAAKDYQEYAERVLEVNDAWAEIALQWEEYRSSLEAYEAALAAEQSFLDQKADAEQDYQDRLEQCAADTKRAIAEAKEKQEEQQKDKEDPKDDEEVPEDSEPADIVCDDHRPTILDEDAPTVPEKPTEPADPRPESSR